MSKEIKRIYVPYGCGHTKRYSKSVVADFLVERSSETGEVHINSDVHLLLRQKNLHKTIGIDVLRNYLEALDNGEPHSHQFSDDELFQLIEPKGLGTITDAYEFSKYLQNNDDKMKSKYKDLKQNYLDRKKYLSTIKND